MILLEYLKHSSEIDVPEFVRITYCFHLVQDSAPPEFIKVDTEVEI